MPRRLGSCHFQQSTERATNHPYPPQPRGYGFELTEKPDDNLWLLRVPIPKDAIADEVQTLVIGDKADGTRIGHFTLIASEALGDDMRVEVELLRAELDILKRAFRRHCVETT
jgi:hypothetical protein